MTCNSSRFKLWRVSRFNYFRWLLISMIFVVHHSAVGADGDVFDDWVMRCDPASESPRCYLSQRAFIQGSSERVFELAVGQLGEGNQIVMLLSAPLGIYLPAGLRVQIDDTVTQRVALQRCNKRGCHAELALNDKHLKLMKNGLQLNIAFSDSALQQFGFAMSLKGFTKGLKQLLAQ